jgi:glycosyltransferase involved in cell wall biosynthesis
MRIAQVSTWQIPCGIAGYTEGLHRALVSRGASCDVFPIDRTRLKYFSKRELMGYYDDLAGRLADYDVVHLQHEFGFFWGSTPSFTLPVFANFLRALRRHRRATFVTFHSEPYVHLRQFPPETRYLPAKHALMQAYWTLRIVPHFAAGTRAIVHTKGGRVALLRSGIPAGAIDVVRQGTPEPREPIDAAERAEAKKRLGLPDDACVMTLFGFVTRHKGYDTILRALRYLPPEYHLLIVGSSHPFSPDRALDDILSWTSRHDREAKRVTLAGFVPSSEIDDHFRATDIAVAPYHLWPRVSSSAAITWALASGCPIVASRVPTFEEIQEEYECLHLAVPEAPAELAYRIRELAADRDLQAKLVRRAQDYCRDHNWGRAADEHLALYARKTGMPMPAPVPVEQHEGSTNGAPVVAQISGR